MDHLAGSLTNLDLGNDRQGRTETSRAELQTALASLRAQFRNLSSRLESISALVSETGLSRQSRETRNSLYNLHRATSHVQDLQLELAGGVEALESQAKISVICEILSLGNANPLCERLVNFFESEIHSITRKVLAKAGNSSHMILWRIAERCYFESCGYGKLDFNDFFNSRNWASPGWPFDPEVIDNPILYHGADCKESSWPGYWARVMNACPSGPTLFNVPLVMWDSETSNRRLASSFYLEETPRYLFRTFDERSSGLNNETIVASQASLEKTPGSRVDFVDLDRKEAAELLHHHLDRRPYASAKNSDNLVSWTTSLLFAIQYAFWRHLTLKHSPGVDSIFICVVDTKKFPHGQFMQDKRLIRMCKDAASSEAQSFFDFRTNRLDYYNGEYLSQGSLKYSGRGRVVSLRTLIDSDLLWMYPGFIETRGWASGARDLRQRWAFEEPLSREDFELAARIAKTCFGDFGGIEIPLMLVCFQARKLSDASMYASLKGIPAWGRYPDEVRRYLEVTAAGVDGFEYSASESKW